MKARVPREAYARLTTPWQRSQQSRRESGDVSALSREATTMAREDRQFARFRRTGDPRALADVFDRTAPELWRVAAHLCKQRETAEDLVQTTFLVVIEQARRWDPERPLLPWLLGILANQARRERRRNTRELDLDRAVRQHDSGADEIAARAELADALRHALERVPAAYRDSLEAHLLSGRRAAEIARARGVPAGTVRMQIRRGLQHLRRLLPQGFVPASITVGALSASAHARMRRVILSRMPRGTSVGATGAGLLGVPVVGAILLKKAVLCSLAVLALSFVTWVLWPRDPAPKPGLPLVAENAAGVAGPEVADAPVSAPAERTIRRGAARAEKGALVLRVHGAGDGTPIPGLRLRWRGRHVLYGVTDAAGSASFEDDPGLAWIDVEGLGTEKRIRVVVEPGKRREQVVEIPAQMRLEVTVVDPHGRVVPGATILGRRDHWDNLSWGPIGRTDDRGRWRRECIRTGLSIGAILEGRTPAEFHYAEGSRGEVVRVRLVVGERAQRLAGTVRDVQGRPVPRARVAVQFPSERPRFTEPLMLRTDAAGRFETTSVPAGRCTVFASTGRPMDALNGSRRRRSFGRASVEVPPGGRDDVVVQLVRGATVLGTLRNARGSPIANKSVSATFFEAGFSHGLLQELSKSARTADDGSFRFTGLLPAAYRLTCRIGDIKVELDVELADTEQYRWDPVLGGQRDLLLRVLGPDGDPLAGCRIQARHATGTLHRGATDAHGRCRLPNLRAVPYDVRILPASGGFSMHAARVTPADTETTLRIAPGRMPTARLKGRLVAGGLSLRGVEVFVERRVHANDVPLTSEEWRKRVRPDSETGRFEFGPTPPGEYAITVLRGRAPLGGASPRHVAAGRVLDFGDILLQKPCSLLVVAHDANGARVRDLTVHARTPGRDRFGRLRGKPVSRGFLVEGLPKLDLELLVNGRDIAPTRRRVSLAAGMTTRVDVQGEAATICAFSPTGAGPPNLVFATLTVRDASGEVALIGRVGVTKGATPLRRGLVPGTYEIELRVGTEIRTQALEVAGGPEQAVRLAYP